MWLAIGLILFLGVAPVLLALDNSMTTGNKFTLTWGDYTSFGNAVWFCLLPAWIALAFNSTGFMFLVWVFLSASSATLWYFQIRELLERAA